MTDLRIFYRLLGIAEHIIEPSYYHLLALDRKHCNAETVKAALLARKNELRQNAPGPEFVPHIVKFEKEQLEPAAAVLADDTKRAEYDKMLAARWEKIKHHTEKRSQLIGAVRMAIANAVDAQGALDRKGKDALGETLKELGVEEHNVEMILDRIPSPLFETGEFGEINADFFTGSVKLAADKGNLDELDKTKLLALADRLNIDKEKAAETMQDYSVGENTSAQITNPDDIEPIKSTEIEAGTEKKGEGIKLTDDNVAAGDVAGDAGKIHLVDEVLDKQQQVDVAEISETSESTDKTEVDGNVERIVSMEDQVARADTPAIKQHDKVRGNSPKAFKYVAIVSGFLVLCAVIYWLSTRGTPDLDEGPVTPPKKVEPSKQPYRPVGDNLGLKIDEAASEQTAKSGSVESDVDAYELNIDFGEEEIMPVKIQLSEAARNLMVKDFTTLSVNDLLADTVVALAASCDRASVFVWKSHAWKAELNEMLASSDLPNLIASRVVFVDVSEEVVVNDSAEDEDYQQLKKDLSSSDKFTRYSAIDRLKNDGSGRAVELLLGDPVDGLSGGKQTVSRRLRALRQINEPYIANELAGRIGLCARASTAQQISLALVDLTGIKPSGTGVLAGKNDQRQRTACSGWWKKTLEDWEPDKALPIESIVDKQLAAEIEMPGKLVGAAASYCYAVAGELSVLGDVDGDDSGAERQKPASTDTNEIGAAMDSESMFRGAARSVNVQLLRAISKIQGEDEILEVTDAVNLQSDRRRRLAVTGFQKVAVEIEATGSLLEVFVAISSPDGRFNEEIEDIRLDRRADIERAGNVLQEIRQHTLYNLRLFDILNSN